VFGPAGQPAQPDEQGRVAVRLWPSEHPQTLDDDAIWLPIAMTRANGRIALDELPCAGSEVWVSFLDSDPDRPILCLGNSRKPTPREPPPARDSS
jgi:type VI secretion system secreted protein VgrG